MPKNFFQNQKVLILYPLIAFLSILILNLVIFNRSFPLSEGWWEAYAYVTQSGMKLYSAIDIAFSPMFVYIDKFIISYLGMNFFNIRLFGVFVFSILVIVLFLFVRKRTDAIVASISVLYSIMLLISTEAFIAKDYHTYEHLLIVLSLISFTSSLDQSQRFKVVVYSALTASIVFLIAMIKQNVGVLLIVSYFLAYVLSYVLEKKKTSLLSVISYVIGVALVAGYFYKIGLLHDLILSMSGNDAKGSILWILSKFLRGETLQILMATLVIVPVFILVIEHRKSFTQFDFSKIKLDRESFKFYLKIIIENKVKLLSLLVLLFTYNFITDLAESYFRIVLFSITFAVILTYFYYLFFKHVDGIFNKYLLFPIAALVYANTTTAQFDYNGLLEVDVIAAAIFVYYLSKSFKEYSVYFLSAASGVVLLLVVQVYQIKIDKPYGWWIGVSKNVFSAKYSLPYKELKGMHVDEDTFNVYSMVHKYVQEFSKKKNDVYFFNLPVFLILEHKLPPYRLVTQWLDVTTTNSINNEFASLKIKTPNLVVAYIPTYSAYKIHAEMKGQVKLFTQEKIINYLFNSVEVSKLKLQQCFSYPVYNRTYDRKVYRIKIIQPGIDIYNEVVKFNALNDAALKISSDDVLKELFLKTKIPQASINIEGEYKNVAKFVSKIGIIDSPLFQSVCVFSKK